MSAPNNQPTPPTYTLLGAESCDAPLPLNPILRELRFGQFIALADSDFPAVGPISGLALKVALPLPFINILLASRARETAHYKAPFAELGPAGDTPGDSVPTIEVASVADLLSRRSVSIRGGVGEVSLSGGVVKQLLAGGSVTVPIKGNPEYPLVRLNASHAVEVAPAALSATHVIDNVHDFLGGPAVTDVQGKRIPVSLQPDQVRELLKNRSIQVMARGEPITIVPATSAEKVDSANCGEPVATAYAMRAGSGDTDRQQIDRSRALREARSLSKEMLSPSDEGRLNVDLSSPQLGFYIPYLQTWKLLGYSRGALLNSFALAPQEETTIELFSWDKRTNALEQTSTSEAEQNIESVDTTKDTTQVTKELTNDTNFHADATTNANVNVTFTKAASGTFGGTASAGGSNTARNVAKNTTDHIHESTRKAALRVKASRQSKVSESRELGSEQRTTRKIRNVNMCHTLNLDYFEILVSYELTTVCLRREAQLVVLIDLPKKRPEWSRTTVRTFEPTLRAALLDRTFIAGFDASRLLAARDEACKVVCERCRCDDEGTPQLSDSAEFAALRDAAYDVLSRFASLRGWSVESNLVPVFLAVAPPDPDNPSGDLPNMAEFVHRWAFSRRMQTEFAGLWAALRSLIAGGVPASAGAISQSTIQTIHAAIPSGEGAPALAGILTVDDEAKQELLDALGSVAVANEIYKDIDKKRLDALGAFLQATIPFFDPVGAAIAALVNLFVVKAAGKALDALAVATATAALDVRFNVAILDDMGLIAALTAFQEAYIAWTEAKQSMLKQSEAYAKALDTLANSRNDELRNAFSLSTVAEAREREQALLLHLKEYDNYYSFALYRARLASGAIDLPLIVKQSNGLISPNPMGLVDGKLAFPVNLDGALTADPKIIKALRDFLNSEIRENTDLDAAPQAEPFSLPTPGITLETRLGGCCACEDFINESRTIDLRQRAALASQAESEAARYAARLNLNPPDLNDPTPRGHEPAITVKVLQEPQPPKS